MSEQYKGSRHLIFGKHEAYPKQKHGLTDARCKQCIYHAKLSGGMVICEYILHEGNRARGCPAGKECKRFLRGTKKRLKK